MSDLINQAHDAEHARFSPSSAERWMTCPGSIALTQQLVASSTIVENTSSSYADEGTAAHTLASRALEYGRPAAFFLGEQIEVNKTVYTVDEDMANYVQVYLDEVHARVGKGTLMFEQKIEFSEAIGVPRQFGTSDAIILSEDCKRACVGDLKYGQGVKVYAENNKQLLTYVVGVLETFDVVMSEVEEIEVFIVQPRLDHVDSWTVPIAIVRKHAEELRVAAGAALEGCNQLLITGAIPPELFGPSEKACFFCPAKAHCEALRRNMSALVFDDFDVLEDPTVLDVRGAPAIPSGDKLGTLYGYLELIEDWARGVRAEVERMVFAGMTVTGPDGQPMKLIQGRGGNRKWRDESTAEARLAGLVPPHKLYKPRVLISVSDVDKMFNKKATREQWKALQDMITQAPGKAKVALGSDPAPAYVAEASGDEFEDLDNG